MFKASLKWFQSKQKERCILGDWPSRLLHSRQSRGNVSGCNAVKRWQVNQSPHEFYVCPCWTRAEYVMYENVMFLLMSMCLFLFLTISFEGKNTAGKPAFTTRWMMRGQTEAKEFHMTKSVPRHNVQPAVWGTGLRLLSIWKRKKKDAFQLCSATTRRPLPSWGDSLLPSRANAGQQKAAHCCIVPSRPERRSEG